MSAYRPMTDNEIHKLIRAQIDGIRLKSEDERGLLHHVVWQLIKMVRESDAGKFPNPFTEEGKAEINRQVEALDEQLHGRHGPSPK